MPAIYPLNTFSLGSKKTKLQARKTEVTEGGYVWSRKRHAQPVYAFKLMHKFVSATDRQIVEDFLIANDGFDFTFQDGISYRVVIDNSEWSALPIGHDGSSGSSGYWLIEVNLVGKEILPPSFDSYADDFSYSIQGVGVTIV